MNQILANSPNAFNDVPVVKNIGGRNVEAYTNLSVDQRRVFVQISPTTAISSNVLAGSTLDFRIENNIDRVTSCLLRVDWSNTSGSNIVHSGPTNMWVQQVQIFAENGSTLIYQTLDPVENWILESVLMSRQEHEVTATLRGTTAAYSTAAITDATATSGSYYYSLCPNFWRSLHIRPYTIDGNFLIRVKFQDTANVITSGTWTTTASYLEFTGYMENEAQKKVMIQRAEKPKYFSYYAPQRHVETLTLAASTQYQVRLSGLNGYANQLFFALRPIASASSPALQFTFVRPDTFDILNASAQSLTGFKNQSASDMIILYSHMYDNVFINNTNACVYSFSQSPTTDCATGTWNGGVHLQGYHILQFTTGSGLAGGSYQVLVYAMCNESLSIENAKARSSRA